MNNVEPVSIHLRVARPVRDLAITERMYCGGLGMRVLARFENHDGFDGVMLGYADAEYHFEFTLCRHHPVVPAPTQEDLAVLYIPDHAQWEQRCADMLAAAFVEVAPFNPYWAVRGRTFQDPDGYRIVLQNTAWNNPL